MIAKNNQTWFKLFASCFLIRGKSASLICDVERNVFYDVPNDYMNILEDLQKVSIYNFKKKSKFKNVLIDTFIQQFISEEIGFLTTEPNAFPNIDLIWQSPYQISNSILQIKKDTNYDVLGVIKQLEELDCQAFQIRIESSLSNELIEKFILVFKKTRVKYVELLIPYRREVKVSWLNDLLISEPRLRFIKVYGSKEDEFLDKDINKLNAKILFFKKDIRKNSREIISQSRFCKNMDVFLESQNYNIGLNRKVSVSSDGSIKNYIDHDFVFGNVKKDKIKNIVFKDNFKSKWLISNDKIEKCKECQYRYSCVSNSDIEQKGKLFHKKETCDFNPETNKWMINK